MRTRHDWLPDELAILHDNYEAIGAYGCAKLIPRHTQQSILKKAQALGIRCDVSKQHLHFGWKKLDAPKNLVRGFNGYVWYKVDGDGGKKVAYHRHVMEQHLGRKLSVNELVHHKNGNKLDNDISNLELITRSEHMRRHREELNAAKAKAYQERKTTKI